MNLERRRILACILVWRKRAHPALVCRGDGPREGGRERGALQRQPYAVTGRSVPGTTVQKHLIETEVENSAQKFNKNKPVPPEPSAGGWSDPLVALAYSNRTLSRAPGPGRLRHHAGLPLTTPQGQYGHASAGAPGPLAACALGDCAASGRRSQESLGTGQGPAGNGDCATRTPSQAGGGRPGAGAIFQQARAGTLNAGLALALAGRGTYGECEPEATCVARVQLDAYTRSPAPRPVAATLYVAARRRATGSAHSHH